MARLRIERHRGYWLLVGTAAPGAVATTLGPLIMVREAWAGDPRLLRHELEHVRQWRDQGVAGFLRRYLGSYLRWRLEGMTHDAAYRRIPQEIEAEWVARRAEVVPPAPVPVPSAG